ncbi:putative cytochrome P450 [Tanacetum coccineum]
MESNSYGSWLAVVSGKKDEFAIAGLVVMVMTLAFSWYKRSIYSYQKGAPPLPPGPNGLPILYLGSKLHVVVNSAELAKVVTGEQDESFANRDPHTVGLSASYDANDIAWKGLAKGAKDSNLSDEIRKVVSGIVEIAEGLNIFDFFPALAQFDLHGVDRKLKKQMKQFDHIFETTIEERINSKPTVIEEASQQKGRKDFLQNLLELKDQISATSINMTQLKAIVVDMFLGGTDATSAMVEWTMTEVLQNPEETFRLHPPLPFLLPRAPSKTCTVGGYPIPEGGFYCLCECMEDTKGSSGQSIHVQTRKVFKPRRIREMGLQWTNSKFFPFGSGRRRCPGVPLGEKMMMHILASLLHSFEWKLPMGEELDLSDKFCIALKKRKPLIVVPTQRLTDLSLYV